MSKLLFIAFFSNDFRRQFAGEMLEVFRQKTEDLACHRGPAIASFVLRELIALPIGATGAWVARFIHRKKMLRSLDTNNFGTLSETNHRRSWIEQVRPSTASRCSPGQHVSGCGKS
jgi:hypothetical protein